MLNSPDYEVSYTFNENHPMNYLYLRVHLTELKFQNSVINSNTLSKLKQHCKITDVKSVKFIRCIFDSSEEGSENHEGRNGHKSSYNMLSYISTQFKELTILSVIQCENVHIYFDLFLEMCNLKHLTLKELGLKSNFQAALNDFFYLKKLETIDMRSCSISLGFYTFFPTYVKSFPNMKEINFSANELSNTVCKDILKRLNECNMKLYVDLSENYLKEEQDFCKMYPNLIMNLKNQKEKNSRNVIMRMLFSRSAIFEENSNEKNQFFQKKMGKKNNGAILPLYLYPSVPKLTFDKEELRRILKVENKIRLSKESQSSYDRHKFSTLESHLQLDKELIIQALTLCGYMPAKDDSLKAYHIATAQYVNDEEVRNQVVWMKYDKCKVGNFKIGDKAIVDDIYLYNLSAEKIYFKELLSSIKPNIIISGSIS